MATLCLHLLWSVSCACALAINALVASELEAGICAACGVWCAPVMWVPHGGYAARVLGAGRIHSAATDNLVVACFFAVASWAALTRTPKVPTCAAVVPPPCPPAVMGPLQPPPVSLEWARLLGCTTGTGHCPHADSLVGRAGVAGGRVCPGLARSRSRVCCLQWGRFRGADRRSGYGAVDTGGRGSPVRVAWRASCGARVHSATAWAGTVELTSRDPRLPRVRLSGVLRLLVSQRGGEGQV